MKLPGIIDSSVPLHLTPPREMEQRRFNTFLPLDFEALDIMTMYMSQEHG